MTPDQKSFHDYIIGFAQDGKSKDVEAILADAFKHQDAGTASKEYLMGQAPKLLALIKPEHQAELLTKMGQFTSTIK